MSRNCNRSWVNNITIDSFIDRFKLLGDSELIREKKWILDADLKKAVNIAIAAKTNEVWSNDKSENMDDWCRTTSELVVAWEEVWQTLSRVCSETGH